MTFLTHQTLPPLLFILPHLTDPHSLTRHCLHSLTRCPHQALLLSLLTLTFHYKTVPPPLLSPNTLPLLTAISFPPNSPLPPLPSSFYHHPAYLTLTLSLPYHTACPAPSLSHQTPIVTSPPHPSITTLADILPAEEGNCWIFNDTSKNEYIWEGFMSQTKIKRLTLHLRPDGTLKDIPTVAVMHLPSIEMFEHNVNLGGRRDAGGALMEGIRDSQ
ncbi:hypothetical protein E2C01_076415 [Portunus trituberculatus]|uniref:Uncharacterized protein n=1 Tax=Portunus trituberculatus TaxID=210409 RepID=A0A5B7I8P0_PORTR|nr:hypothetical protein [Portunus trituberculatus]